MLKKLALTLLNPAGSVLVRVGMALASEEVVKVVVVKGLKKLASSTKNTLDDDIVTAIEAKLG